MAKHEVTFSCGHNGTVVLFGNRSQRERRVAWYEREGLCPDCWRNRPQTPVVYVKLFDDTEVELAVGCSYHIKDELKSRGYRFEGSTKTWKKVIPLSSFPEEWGWLETKGAQPDLYFAPRAIARIAELLETATPAE